MTTILALDRDEHVRLADLLDRDINRQARPRRRLTGLTAVRPCLSTSVLSS